MQRLLIRLSAVGSILVLGVLAIAQTQFKESKGDAVSKQPRAESPEADEIASRDGIPQPIPSASDDSPAELAPPSASAFRAVRGSDDSALASQPGQTSSHGVSPPPPAFDAGSSAYPTAYDAEGLVRTVAGQSPAEPDSPSERFVPDGGGALIVGRDSGGGDAMAGSPPAAPPSAGSQFAFSDGGEGYAGTPDNDAPPADSSATVPSPSPPGAYDAGSYQPESDGAEYAGPEYAGPEYAGPEYAGAGYAGPPSTEVGTYEAPNDEPPSSDAAEAATETQNPAAGGEVAGSGGGQAETDAQDVAPEQPESAVPGYGAAGRPPRPAQDPAETNAERPESSAIGTRRTPADSAPVEIPGYGADSGTAGAANSLPDRSQTGQSPGGSGEPGDRALDGVQTPTLTVEKIAPPEIQVNRPASFQIRVRNVGRAAAHQVIVLDEVPRGTRLIQARPDFTRSPDGALTWQLGSLAPGQDATITMELLPLEEGEIGSVAQVSFQAEASVRTLCTQPKLVLQHTAPPKVLIGQDVVLSIALANEGTGAATNVVIEEEVPEGLSHAAGRQLEYEVGTLRPGETKNLELPLRAAQPGLVRNQLVVRAAGEILVTDELEVEVIAPRMKLAVDGPTKRYLERQATYEITVANDGTAVANDVELTAHLPPGFKFVSTNNQGRYDPQAHAVLWSLAELPAGAAGSVELTVLPVNMGEHRLRVAGQAAMDLADVREHRVVVEGLAALSFQLGDVADPIPVGTETVYEIRVSNTGSKASTNVRLTATVPAGMQPLSGEGPTRVVVQGQQVTSEPIAELAPRGDAIYKFRVRGGQPGDQRVRVQLESDELEAPILKEESTRVYSDR